MSAKAHAIIYLILILFAAFQFRIILSYERTNDRLNNTVDNVLSVCAGFKRQ